MTPYSVDRQRGDAQGIHSLPFYVGSLKRLSATRKFILLLVADCFERGPPFQPSLLALARLCSCSRRTVMAALDGLDGNHGWIIRDWRGGQKTNVYLPGWRLKRVLQRYRQRGT